mmetsp:Transcript_11163/g.37921  ORF Transcript_11163/g.37921 Transcript_11163/m.37921 type:complete len:169 (-) Transcript_11163:1152-1658(-)
MYLTMRAWGSESRTSAASSTARRSLERAAARANIRVERRAGVKAQGRTVQKGRAVNARVERMQRKQKTAALRAEKDLHPVDRRTKAMRGSPCLITSKSFLEWYLSNAMSAVVCTAANDKPLDPLLPIEQEIAQNDMAQDHCASKNLVCRTSCTYGMNLTKPYTTDLTW